MASSKMNPEIKTRWVEALRSGEFRQGRLNLVNSNDEYCCLGVLCEIAVKDGVIKHPENDEVKGFVSESDSIGTYIENSVLPDEVMNWAGLDSPNPDVWVDAEVGTASVATLNDYKLLNFFEIADLVEKDL